jgi:SnoaL-like domain
MEFSDYSEVIRRRYEYAFGIDTRDYGLLRSVFTDEITMDFADYSGQPAATLNADDWVAGCRRLFDGLDATQHVMTNPLVEVSGSRALCTMYMKAEHFLNNEHGSFDYAIGGYYVDQLSKIDGRWLINAVTLKLFWRRGNRHIMQLAVGQ